MTSGNSCCLPRIFSRAPESQASRRITLSFAPGRSGVSPVLPGGPVGNGIVALRLHPAPLPAQQTEQGPLWSCREADANYWPRFQKTKTPGRRAAACSGKLVATSSRRCNCYNFRVTDVTCAAPQMRPARLIPVRNEFEWLRNWRPLPYSTNFPANRRRQSRWQPCSLCVARGRPPRLLTLLAVRSATNSDPFFGLLFCVAAHFSLFQAALPPEPPTEFRLHASLFVSCGCAFSLLPRSITRRELPPGFPQAVRAAVFSAALRLISAQPRTLTAPLRLRAPS